jgi:hypothetical protein
MLWPITRNKFPLGRAATPEMRNALWRQTFGVSSSLPTPLASLLNGDSS